MNDRRQRKRLVDAWVAAHGYTCPGWKRPAHDAMDLTADHIVPQSEGGAFGEMQVLCRSCNSSRGAKGPPVARVELWPPAPEFGRPS